MKPTVILYGPFGCGKKSIAKSLGAELCNSFNSFYSCASENFTTEEIVKEIFAKAAETPSFAIIVFEEIDAFPLHMVNHLVKIMQNLKPNIGIIGTTSRPAHIDQRLVECFNHRLYMPLPDTSARLQILKANLENIPIARAVSLEGLAKECDGYSGFELRKLCITAAHEAAIEIVEQVKQLRKQKRMSRRVAKPIVADSLDDLETSDDNDLDEFQDAYDTLKVKPVHFEKAFGKVKKALEGHEQTISECEQYHRKWCYTFENKGMFTRKKIPGRKEEQFEEEEEFDY